MGKPRMIILIRHAQSEGNLNRDVHQIIPDHRVKLTPDGWTQAEEVGHALRESLRPDDTIRIYTSPYRRTRETTEGLLRSLTGHARSISIGEATHEESEASDESNVDDGSRVPSPFSRSNIKIYEEPRLREQDFGNFQPCSAEMERMWQERADYGHFFYRIPNGESAADAYDRISGFNDSLWRSFGEDDFPSVCILVTHGLMTRVFLMRWYHWSVEYFEDLRNINHCERIIMQRSEENGKYILQNKLRTWSELKRRATLANKDRRPSHAATSSTSLAASASPVITRKWGGCVDGCNHQSHAKRTRPARAGSTTTLPRGSTTALPALASTVGAAPPIAVPAPEVSSTSTTAPQQPTSEQCSTKIQASSKPILPGAPTQPLGLAPLSLSLPSPLPSPFPAHLRGRDAGGSLSGYPTPATDTFPETVGASSSPSSGSGPVSPTTMITSAEPADAGLEIVGDATPTPHADPRRVPGGRTSSGQAAWAGYFPTKHSSGAGTVSPETIAGGEDAEGVVKSRAGRGVSKGGDRRALPRRRTTRQDMENWMAQSGMGQGARADALGDPEEDDEEDHDDDDGDEDEHGDDDEDGDGNDDEDRDGSGHGDDAVEDQGGDDGTAAAGKDGPGDIDAQVRNMSLDEVKAAEAKDKSLRESVY